MTMLFQISFLYDLCDLMENPNEPIQSLDQVFG